MKFPLFKAQVNDVEALRLIGDVFRSGFINEGEAVTQLTNELRAMLRADNLILLNSCTSALTLALKLSGVTPNDDVVTTPMTCVATNTPIINLGADIVWADVNPLNGMVYVTDVAQRITKATKAVIAVAWAGTPPPGLDELYALCKSKKVKLILDAAHAFDAYYAGRPIHEFADFTCYSFQAIKHFTTGDGGALICKSNAVYKRSKALKWFGLDRDKAKDAKGDWKGQQWDVDIVEAGYKFNMNNMAAAVGLANIKNVQVNLAKHRRNASFYDAFFEHDQNVTPALKDEKSYSSHWVYTMTFTDESLHDAKEKRDGLLAKLNAEGIQAGLVHVPNDSYSCFSKYRSFLPGVQSFASRQFSLPCGPWMSIKDVEYVARKVQELTHVCTT